MTIMQKNLLFLTLALCSLPTVAMNHGTKRPVGSEEDSNDRPTKKQKTEAASKEAAAAQEAEESGNESDEVALDEAYNDGQEHGMKIGSEQMLESVTEEIERFEQDRAEEVSEFQQEINELEKQKKEIEARLKQKTALAQATLDNLQKTFDSIVTSLTTKNSKLQLDLLIAQKNSLHKDNEIAQLKAQLQQLFNNAPTKNEQEIIDTMYS